MTKTSALRSETLRVRADTPLAHRRAELVTFLANVAEDATRLSAQLTDANTRMCSMEVNADEEFEAALNLVESFTRRIRWAHAGRLMTRYAVTAEAEAAPAKAFVKTMS